MRIRWARSATKHRISRERSRFVLEHCGLWFEHELPARAPGADPRLLFLGDDHDGISLEVMGIELANGDILVIHAMPMRSRYQEQYEEANQWRK